MVMPDLKLPSKSKECDRALIVASFLALMLAICMLLILPALAGTETGEFCPTCPDWTDLDGWLAKKEAYEQEQQQKAQPEEQEMKLSAQSAEASPVTSESNSAPDGLFTNRTGAFAEALASPMAVLPEDVVLDISPSAARYIKGAVNINYESFFEKGGRLRTVSEMAKLLGEAGIS